MMKYLATSLNFEPDFMTQAEEVPWKSLQKIVVNLWIS